MIRDERGFGIVQVMVIFACATIPLLATMAFNSYLDKRNKDTGGVAAIDYVRQNLLMLINDDASLVRTIQQNPAMSCLKGNGQTCQVYRLYTINLWDRTGAQPYYNPTTGGFSSRGVPCTNYPSLSCPFRYGIQYAAVNNARYPIFAIFVQLQVADVWKNLTGKVVLNPSFYSHMPPADFQWPPAATVPLPKGIILKQAHP